ncbi:MAG: hypothetical protein ACXV5Q_07665 [Frankiaceae bacterium]
MQFSGVFAFFWNTLARTADQPVSGREAEIAQLESLYRGRGVPLTGAQVGARLAVLVGLVALATLVTALVLTPA